MEYSKIERGGVMRKYERQEIAINTLNIHYSKSRYTIDDLFKDIRSKNKKTRENAEKVVIEAFGKLMNICKD